MKKISDLTATARAVLGVESLSTQEQIHTAYRKKAQKFHPDRTGKERTMKLINQAYEILIKPDFNRKYDLLEEFNDLVSKKENEKIKTHEEFVSWHKSRFYGEGVI